MYVVVNACCCQKMHSFIPNISIAPFQFTITQGLPRLQHLYCVAVNTLKRNRQLRAKDLPKVHTRRLEWESNLRPSGRKTPKLLLSHHASHWCPYDLDDCNWCEGCVPSPLLFNIFLEMITVTTLDGINEGADGGESTGDMRFADDIALLAKKTEGVQKGLTRVA